MNLLPCPFCGGAVQFHGPSAGDNCNGCHHIWCLSCGVMVDYSDAADPHNDSETLTELREKCAAFWNRRAE